MEDTKLLRLLRNDPNSGMEILMEQYAGLVYAVVRGKLAGETYYSSDVEDCVADVFSEFYRDLAKYDPSMGSIKAYLCQIARNNAIDLLRQSGKLKERISTDDEESMIQIADPRSVEDELLEKELRQEVLSAVHALGDPDTQIILRKFYFLQSSKEIAEGLKMSVSNVDTRTHRALAKLRKLFGGTNT